MDMHHHSGYSSASEVTTLRRYTNLFIIIIIIKCSHGCVIKVQLIIVNHLSIGLLTVVTPRTTNGNVKIYYISGHKNFPSLGTVGSMVNELDRV